MTTSLVELACKRGAAWASKHLKRLVQRLDKVSGCGGAATQMSYGYGSNIDSPVWAEFKNSGNKFHANHAANVPVGGCGFKVHK